MSGVITVKSRGQAKRCCTLPLFFFSLQSAPLHLALITHFPCAALRRSALRRQHAENVAGMSFGHELMEIEEKFDEEYTGLEEKHEAVCAALRERVGQYEEAAARLSLADVEGIMLQAQARPSLSLSLWDTPLGLGAAESRGHKPLRGAGRHLRRSRPTPHAPGPLRHVCRSTRRSRGSAPSKSNSRQ